ncbi:MAG: hypothetical protein WBP04_01880 [Candidatus Microsaccharimonas sp.]
MKLVISIAGFVVGYGLTSALVAPFGWEPAFATVVAILAGIAVAVVAYAFYSALIALSIALFVGSFALGISQQIGLSDTTAFIIGGIVGVIMLVIVLVLKVVDVLFALVTSWQGAGLVVSALYILINPSAITAFQTSGPVVLFGLGLVWVIAWVVIAVGGFVFQLRWRRPKETV